MRKHVRILAATLVVGVLLVGGVLATAVPANALPTFTRPPQPGVAGVVWGVPIATFPACAASQTVEQYPTNGGWTGTRSVVSTSQFSPGSSYVRSVSKGIGEPCFDSTASGINRLKMPHYTFALAYAPTPPVATADAGFGVRAGVSVVPRVWCGTAEWSQPSSSPITGTGGNYGGDPAQTANFRYAAPLNYFNTGTCNYIQKIELPACVPSPLGGATCTMMTWEADRAFRNAYYSDDDPYVAICEANPNHSDCVFILPNDDIDGSDFDVVCANPPLFEVPDWDGFNRWVPYVVDWWNAAIGHYGRCLFVPVNGWDRDGAVYESWVRIGLSAANESIQDALFGWSFYESCGVVFSAPIMGHPFAVNTCDIPANVATPIKGVISIVVGMASLIGYILFIANIVNGIANRKIASPDLSDGDK